MQMADANASTTRAEDPTTASKVEPEQDNNTPSSIEFSPEPGAEQPIQDPTQPQKKRGGRKPVSVSLTNDLAAY